MKWARPYAAPNGRRPVREWILDLSGEDRRLVGRDVQKVEFGWPLGMPYCRPLDRLLDPDYASVTLATLWRAAAAVGRRLHVELV